MLGLNTIIAKAVMTKAIKKILTKQGFEETEFYMKEFELYDGDEGQSVIDIRGTFIVENDELWRWLGKRL